MSYEAVVPTAPVTGATTSNTRWNMLKPYQRELCLAAAFDLGAVALIALVVVIVAAAWPGLLVGALVVASLLAIPVAIAGQLFAYRIEDRCAARLGSNAWPADLVRAMQCPWHDEHFPHTPEECAKLRAEYDEEG